jgi:biotin transport system substrate-specific component
MDMKKDTLVMASTRSGTWMRVLVGSLILAASGQIRVPLWPVPMTLQTAAVAYLVYRFGYRIANAAIGLWLLEGACGAPVFAGFTGGLPILFGSTGGYFVGFLVEAWLASKWYRPDVKGVFSLALRGICCDAGCVLCGYLWLAQMIGYKAAFISGVAPFPISVLVRHVCLAWLLKHRRL